MGDAISQLRGQQRLSIPCHANILLRGVEVRWARLAYGSYVATSEPPVATYKSGSTLRADKRLLALAAGGGASTCIRVKYGEDFVNPCQHSGSAHLSRIVCSLVSIDSEDL